jgi:hypothetical protein
LGNAEKYNGPGYQQNKYDEKMQNAYLKYKKNPQTPCDNLKRFLGQEIKNSGGKIIQAETGTVLLVGESTETKALAKALGICIKLNAKLFSDQDKVRSYLLSNNLGKITLNRVSGDDVFVRQVFDVVCKEQLPYSEIWYVSQSFYHKH